LLLSNLLIGAATVVVAPIVVPAVLAGVRPVAKTLILDYGTGIWVSAPTTVVGFAAPIISICTAFDTLRARKGPDDQSYLRHSSSR
jgi:hypothetical protein